MQKIWDRQAGPSATLLAKLKASYSGISVKSVVIPIHQRLPENFFWSKRRGLFLPKYTPDKNRLTWSEKNLIWEISTSSKIAPESLFHTQWETQSLFQCLWRSIGVCVCAHVCTSVCVLVEEGSCLHFFSYLLVSSAYDCCILHLQSFFSVSCHPSLLDTDQFLPSLSL